MIALQTAPGSPLRGLTGPERCAAPGSDPSAGQAQGRERPTGRTDRGFSPLSGVKALLDHLRRSPAALRWHAGSAITEGAPGPDLWGRHPGRE